MHAPCSPRAWVPRRRRSTGTAEARDRITDPQRVCDVCQYEAADLVAFAQEHRDDTVVTGNDDGEEDSLVRAYRKKYAITYPIAMDRRDGQVWQLEAKNFGYSATIVIRPDGVVSCAWVDSVDKEWLENERLVALLP